MARHTEHETTNIFAVVDSWRNDCLLADGSLLWPEDEVWTAETIDELHGRFNEKPLEDPGRNFEQKFQEQLDGAPRAVYRLAAEIIGVHFLFVSSVSAKAKRALVRLILSWDGETFDDTSALWAALGEGIGSGGPGFNYYRPFEIGFVVDFSRRFKAEELDRRRELLADPWAFEEWLDAGEASTRQMRHIILHLLFPDEFERISSGGDKARVARTFADLAGDEADLDLRLYAIRQELERLLPDQELDFYWSPLAEAWASWSGESEFGPLDALQYKKQVVLYGPPGTGKTFRAERLAELLIRRYALRSWGAARYFESQDEVEAAVTRNVRRLQLHPSYSYEEFIRGLVLTGDGGTEYRDGYLLRLISEIGEQPAKERLPYVLILDELNRVDLSRVLGEAFSLLADREASVDLVGLDDDVRTVRIPDDLFFVGTMNLIDQSVEQLDFALRRRFLWILCPFDPDALIEILEASWEPVRNFTWERIQADMELLVEAASRLNAAVGASELLGEQYEVGHTYFLDIVYFLRAYLETRRSASAFLWRNGKADEPTKTLWRLSLEPLLREYLAGLEPASREAELATLRLAFLGA